MTIYGYKTGELQKRPRACLIPLCRALKRSSNQKRSIRKIYSMKFNLKYSVSALAIAGLVGITGGTVTAVAAPFFQQDQAPDYSKNPRYQQGMREGQSDQTRKLDHSKKRHFKKADDQKAYEAGYQKGHGN
jgi:hypothetical protein